MKKRIPIKRRKVWLGLLACLALAACSGEEPAEGPARAPMGTPASALTQGQKGLLGQPAPEFALRNLEGTEVSLSDGKGKVVMLDFWATWCSPCRATMPILHKIADQFADQGVVLYSINEAESPEQMQDFLADLEFKPEVLLDADMEVGALYQVDGLPYTVLIDRAGSVRALHIGFFPNFEETLREEVGKLAHESQQAAAR